jgi:acetyl-CoA carboxylase biotin carboxylase subunit
VFRRVLVANRGEIALRIVRACRKLAIHSVVVYSEADRNGPWLDEADSTICIGPARALQSYLDGSAILQAAEQAEVQAIHPGYGFLAENAVFAARCFQHGITFIGPPPAVIRSMGEKALAKQTMARAGLPTIPGSDGVLADLEQARQDAVRCGYPVLLKASAGGGGKGIRLCRDEAELQQGFMQATLEAEKAFGDPALYLEKFVEGARHIEFQVLCDAFGTAVHLGERDCSIQRKHQKLIEESPSTVIDPATRERLGELVAEAISTAGYRNAGTVEFLRAPDGQFYFMEMNTRLQVEHPVTEMVTGTDLVEEQLKIAANQPLSMEQQQIKIDGHAIEFRINAEDPTQGLRPDPGVISEFSMPETDMDGIQIRWDSAVREGYRIPPHYDSMIGKLIVHGPDRPAVLKAAARTLSNMHIQGVSTTIPLHLKIIKMEAFLEGNYDINSLEQSGLITDTRMSADGQE